MSESLNRTEITPKVVRRALKRSNLSNIAVARELKIAISTIRDFRKGNDTVLSSIQRVKVYTLTKKGTF